MEVRAIRPDARTNEQIRSSQVRLVGEDGTQYGIVPLEDALKKAQEAELDLVEVAPEAKPPVCRIYDFKKVLFDQKRKMKMSRKKTRSELKECRMRVTIDPNDRATKLRKVREFLEKGDKVKFTFQFRGREVTKPQLGTQLVDAVMQDLKDIAEMEKPPLRNNRFMHMIVTRKKDWKPKQEAAAKKNEELKQAEAEEAKEAREVKETKEPEAASPADR